MDRIGNYCPVDTETETRTRTGYQELTSMFIVEPVSSVQYITYITKVISNVKGDMRTLLLLDALQRVNISVYTQWEKRYARMYGWKVFMTSWRSLTHARMVVRMTPRQAGPIPSVCSGDSSKETSP